MLLVTLPLWFFLIAALYATVGFGGGSSYTALLALTATESGMEIWRIPILALLCNITVVAMGSWLAVRRRAFAWRQAMPFIAGSVPMAFIGGLLPLRDDVYLLLLAVSLLLAGARLLWLQDVAGRRALSPSPKLALGIGGGLGLLSGMVGIGGGIFLAPVLHYARWASAQAIAALCSFFILVNSLAGLAGQVLKNQAADLMALSATAAPLMLAVALGGWLGSRLLLEKLSGDRLRQITALLIIFVALRLLGQLYF